jgi:hypothetical protein
MDGVVEAVGNAGFVAVGAVSQVDWRKRGALLEHRATVRRHRMRHAGKMRRHRPNLVPNMFRSLSFLSHNDLHRQSLWLRWRFALVRQQKPEKSTKKENFGILKQVLIRPNA